MRKVCWKQPLPIGSDCEYGADCTTSSCNRETNKCDYYCSPYKPEMEQGDGSDGNLVLNVERGLCNETQRCGDTVLLVSQDACEPKYQVSYHMLLSQNLI